ncbi:MAG: ribose 5-phosphate isomerase B [Eubacteriaceae bacterium]|nr:ribose 5-phosphate isomerase B [Eubacteriaceae bacterium]
MKIAIASDHGGFALKETIIGCLMGMYYEVLDLGTDSAKSVDYPEYGFKCAEAVASGEADRGIVVCGSGIGISIAANKVKGIRCALCTSKEMAELSRKHNDANMLALGGRLLETIDALDIMQVWLDTEFEGGRHQRRVDMLNNY